MEKRKRNRREITGIKSVFIEMEDIKRRIECRGIFRGFRYFRISNGEIRKMAIITDVKGPNGKRLGGKWECKPTKTFERAKLSEGDKLKFTVERTCTMRTKTYTTVNDKQMKKNCKPKITYAHFADFVNLGPSETPKLNIELVRTAEQVKAKVPRPKKKIGG